MNDARPTLYQITPFLHVPNLEAALDRRTRVLEERGRAPLAPDQARMTVSIDKPNPMVGEHRLTVR